MVASEGEVWLARKGAWVEGGLLRTARVGIGKDKTNPRRIAYLILLLFAVPPGWPLFAMGAALVIAAVLLHGWAAGYLARAGYVDRAKILTARGPYRYNRNPYYVAHLTMDFGFFCVAGLPLLYLLYFPIIYSVYRTWVMNEEPFLDAEFGDDYRAWQREVPRWRMRLTPAPPRGREQVFTWAMFKLNNELPRAASHIFLLGIFALYFIFGNPWAGMEPLVRATLVGMIAAWCLLRDVRPLEVSRVHTGWIGLAGAVALGGVVFLAIAPVWGPWPIAVSWVAVAIGALLGLVASLLTLPAFTRARGQTLARVFARPMSQWYAVGLGLGLLTLMLGGVWIGMLVPLVYWAFGLAGIAPMRPIPQSAMMTLALLLGFGAFEIYALYQLLA
jgi:protein-S-isoprenylcysteine O-methyltransferase Ste14